MKSSEAHLFPQPIGRLPAAPASAVPVSSLKPKGTAIRRFLSLLGLLTVASVAGAQTQDYKFTNLGTLGGATSYAADINNRGQIVGWARIAAGTYRAFSTTTAGPMIDLGTLGGESFAK